MSASTTPIPFDEVLEAIEGLTTEEQTNLVDIVRRRLAERGRARVAEEVREARRELAKGRSRPTTAEELIDKLFS